MAWYDLFRLWKYATKDNPLSRREKLRNLEGSGVIQPDVMPDIRGDGSYAGGGRGSIIRLRDSTDFIDLSSVTNRQSRYKEYERLRTVAEIETAMTVYADESCVSGDTKVATPLGEIPISKLASVRKPDELFLVYCWDFDVDDVNLGWAYHPRKTGKKKTVDIIFDDGTILTCTPDHKILKYDGSWVEAGQLKRADQVKAHHRIRPGDLKDKFVKKYADKQHPRILTTRHGFKSERSLLDEFRGKKSDKQEYIDTMTRCIANGLNSQQMGQYLKKSRGTIDEHLGYEGVNYSILKRYHENNFHWRTVINITEGNEIDVYDLTVTNHHNFCTDSAIVHNCQLGENNHVCQIKVKSTDIKEELEFLLFHPAMLNVDRKMYTWAKNLYITGDYFVELVIDPEEPKQGILKVQPLPPDSIYRIETIKGKLLEFQQSKTGPDYESLARVEVTQATDLDLMQATAIRFAPEQIVHFRIGDERRTFYPYGVSLIEPARGPAHSLQLMEDAMMVYRLARAPERRVWYIDVGQLPPFKAEMVVDRLKDTLRKKKTINIRGGSGMSSVEERFQTLAPDDDFWIPTRPNTNTRVETLPGASNLSEIDDAVLFRNKLFIALQFPKSYMSQEDPSVTRMNLSAVDAKFARHVMRLQQSLADGLLEICVRHLELRGFPKSLYDDLQLNITPPSHIQKLSDNEVKEILYQRAMALAGSQLFSKYDILVKILDIGEDEAKQMVARALADQLQQLRLQMIAANPELMGVVQPTQPGQELGSTQGGPSPQLTGQEEAQPAQPTGNPEQPEGSPEPEPEQEEEGKGSETKPFPEPHEDDIKRFDLEIDDYSQEIDEEEIDVSELDDDGV